MKFKRKKNVRHRGSKTHGWGAMKKHRGAGNRGGRGAAGSGKKGDAKKPSIWKGKYFGKLGFVSKSRIVRNGINVSDIEANIGKFEKKGACKKEGNKYVIDLRKAGYTKLLGAGNLGIVCDISVECASKKAVEKVEAKGGKVITLGDKLNGKETGATVKKGDETKEAPKAD